LKVLNINDEQKSTIGSCKKNNNKCVEINMLVLIIISSHKSVLS